MPPSIYYGRIQSRILLNNTKYQVQPETYEFFFHPNRYQ